MCNSVKGVNLYYQATTKKFKFANSRNLPLYYCSAADGTNVVRVFKEAIRLAVEETDKPTSDFTEEVMRTLEYFDMKVLNYRTTIQRCLIEWPQESHSKEEVKKEGAESDNKENKQKSS